MTPELYESLYKKRPEAGATSFKVSSNMPCVLIIQVMFQNIPKSFPSQVDPESKRKAGGLSNNEAVIVWFLCL